MKRAFLATGRARLRSPGQVEAQLNVISASRRTDIPAFHAEWFMNQIRSGRTAVASPFNRGLLEVSLAPEDVTTIVFWTKNASPLLEYLAELRDRGHCFTFLYTINNYPCYVEPRVPDLTHTMKVLERLGKVAAGPMIRWRYDTIVLTEELGRSWHLKSFGLLCELLSQFTNECIFSFCDYYKKTIRNMERVVPGYFIPDIAECRDMAEEMAAAAREEGIALVSCAHDSLTSDTIGKARCIDPRALSAVVDSPERKQALSALKAAPTRKDCGCFASVDIGAYDTCNHGCIYCYANTNPEQAERNLALIRPESDCLDPRRVRVKDESQQ